MDRGVIALQAERELYTLQAPCDGVLLSAMAHESEIVAAGAPLLTVGDTESLLLTVYIPETQIGRVRRGQGVRVTVDSYPDRAFAASVDRIADEAEFTPRNVTTAEERATLVFAVQIGVPNPDGALKPGMPADVAFLEGGPQ